jgi:hypothetical protein
MSRYVQRGGFGFLHGSFLFSDRPSIFSHSMRQRARVPPLAPHKVLKSGALSSPGEAGQMAQWMAVAGAALQRGAALAKANEAVRAAQEKATAEAEAAKK